MLNYSTKWINTVAICISIVVTVVLFIFFDILIINPDNSSFTHSENIMISQVYLDKKYIKNISRENINAIKLKDVMLETMQIADIYEKNTNVNNLENNVEDNEMSIEEQENIIKQNYKTNWRIEIPKIGLVAPIKDGTTQDVLASAVGHFPESNTYRGNVALAGHNRGYNCNFFENIKKLKTGDKIIYYTDRGRREYKVVLNKIIHQTDWTYIEDTSDNRITLITCVENMYEYRRCVQAVEII